MHLMIRLLICCCLASLSWTQALDNTLDKGHTACPGDPPGNLASFDCSFTFSMRTQSFIASSVTDQAALGALFFGSIAHLQNSPSEWGRGWRGFGDRVGSRYAQNMAKGLTEFTIGGILRTDPRAISYAADPRVKNYRAGVSPRIGHAFVDFLTVRRSTHDGKGLRLPNIPLLAGASASAFVGNIWYPQAQTTPKEVGIRAGSSLGTALFASFYNEFKPEANRLLAVIFRKRG